MRYRLRQATKVNGINWAANTVLDDLAPENSTFFISEERATALIRQGLAEELAKAAATDPFEDWPLGKSYGHGKERDSVR